MSDKARMSMGVTDFGTLELRGTNEFVGKAINYSGEIITLLLEKHVENEVAAGKTYDEAHAEFQKAYEKAVANMEKLDEENSSVSFKVGK